MKIYLNPQTIYLLVGPSQCGKTFFAKNCLEPNLKHYFENVQYLSSDEMRQSLLGQPLDKYDPAMMQVSEGAFKLLFTKLRTVTSYPVNADAIIVDTTGLTKEFRNEVLQIAKEKGYATELIVFAYKNRKDFYLHHDGRRKDVTAKHVTRLYRDFFKEMNRREYAEVHMVESPDFHSIRFIYSIPSLEYANFSKKIAKTSHIIGDIHGCLDELKDLLNKMGLIKNGEWVTQDRVILLGDYLDKGPKILETIDFIYENRDKFLIITANHENFVYKALQGENFDVPESIVEEYFNSIKLLENDPERKQKFFTLFESYTYPYLRGQHYIATHAPVENRFLGKINEIAKKKMRNLRYTRRREIPEGVSYEAHLENNDLAFLKEEATRTLPLHFFGHVPFEDRFLYKNKIGLDTGCVYGNKLTGATIYEDGKVKYTSVASTQPKIEGLLKALFYDDGLDMSALEYRDRKRLEWLAKDKINYISGTMSPADKLGENLESLEWGLNYYKEKGYPNVMLQKKYMGSRCNIYLFPEVEKCYAVSRNGFKVKNDLTEVYKKLIPKIYSLYRDNKPNLIILDGELMPWAALGKGLIDETYKTLAASAESELRMLQTSGFDRVLFSKVCEYIEVKDRMGKEDKKTLQEEFGNAKYNTFDSLRTYYFEGFGEREYYLNVYKKQIEVFGADTTVDFKGFNVLKTVWEDREEINDSQYNGYMLANQPEGGTEFLFVDLNKEDMLEEAKVWYEENIIANNLEGCVIKPDIVRENVAPFLKVRTMDYLTIVYGYDFQKERKMTRLLKQKSIRGKLKTSIKEHELGQKMLAIPYSDIENSELYLKLGAKFIGVEKTEAALDPRL
jgi:predicted kinase